MGLVETLGRFLNRVELVIAGAETSVREAEEALAARDALRARAAAHAVLARVPGSPFGLALLADACTLGGLDAELVSTLEDLAARLPQRADVWARLAEARRKTGAPPEEVREAWLTLLPLVDPSSPLRREALLALADLDLAHGDGDRAELWLDRLGKDVTDPVVLRRAEAAVLRGRPDLARRLLARHEVDPLDGRAALAHGRALAQLGDEGCFAPLLRALVLDAPGATSALATALGTVPSTAEIRARVRAAAVGAGVADLPRFRAAFSRAEGDRDGARTALVAATLRGEAGAAVDLAAAALEDRDPKALAIAVAHLRADEAPPWLAAGRALLEAVPEAPTTSAAAEEALARLDGRAEDSPSPLVDALFTALATEAAAALSGPPRPGEVEDLDPLLRRLQTLARRTGSLAALAALEDLAQERKRPVRAAIVGEFNAGKSTFINAVVGAEIAPTGVLPTTATLHHVQYAPDLLARIVFHPGEGDEPLPPRLVPPSALRSTLNSLPDGAVARVTIALPLPALTRLEILDTPGFNAPDPRHAAAAREAFEEADVLLFVFDASQAGKASERAVLDEARVAALPVQAFLNKADRLREDELPRVLLQVEEALAASGAPTVRPPIPLSARRALEARVALAAATEDGPREAARGALEACGFGAVEAFIDEVLVDGGARIKQRAVRRRAARVVAALLGEVEGLVVASEAALRVAEEQEERRRRVSGELARQEAEIPAIVAGALARPLESFRAELRPLADADPRDRAVRRYVEGRALHHLREPLRRILERLLDGATVDAGAADAAITTALRLFAASPSGPVEGAIAAVLAAYQELLAPRPTPPPGARARRDRAELARLAAALTPPGAR